MDTDCQWFVRAGNGKEYGPAALATLIAWAREGRIEPTSLISSDRKTWSPAPLMRELGMEWLVETEFGRFFGPFHRNVVESLSARKMLPRSSRTYRLTLTAGQPPAANRSAELSEALSQAQKELSSSQAKADALSEGLADERRHASAVAEALDQAKKQNAVLTDTLNQSKKDNAALREDAEALSTELKQAQRQCLTLNEKLKRTQEQANLALAKLDDFAKRLAKADTDKAALTARLADQQLRQKHLQTELAQTQSEGQVTRSELENTRKGLKNAQSELKSTRTELMSTQTELKNAQTELKNAHAEFNKVLTELKVAQSDLKSALGKIEDEQNKTKDLEKKLAKANKAGQKSGGLFQGLFGGSSSGDLSALELAVRRELAAAKHQQSVRRAPLSSAPRSPDVIDV